MMAPSRIEIALGQIDEWIGAGGVQGAAAAVWHNGQIVADRYAGMAKADVVVADNTLFALASVTKPITAATVMALHQTGALHLDDAVADYVPQFLTSVADDPLADARTSVTIRQLLCHTSGLPEDLKTGTFRSRDLPSLDQITDAYLQLPLAQPPGESMLYSNAGYGILGRLIEQVTGRDIWDVTWDVVQQPLELHDILARPGPGLDDRIAHVDDPGKAGRPSESYNTQYWRDLGIPWGGLFGSVRNLAAFAGAFLTAESSLMNTESRHQMVTDQVNGLPGRVLSARVEWPAAAWGLGWEVKGEKRKHWTGELTSPETFCHFGAAGTLVWGDPALDVALAVFANRSTIHLWPFVPPRWARLSNSIVSAVTHS